MPFMIIRQFTGVGTLISTGIFPFILCAPYHLGHLFVLAYFIYIGQAAPRAPFLFSI